MNTFNKPFRESKRKIINNNLFDMVDSKRIVPGHLQCRNDNRMCHAHERQDFAFCSDSKPQLGGKTLIDP